jgi:ABC-type branched-subunit amino acid transport system ATPase component
MGDGGARVLSGVAETFQSFKETSEISVYENVAIEPEFGGRSEARFLMSQTSCSFLNFP